MTSNFAWALGLLGAIRYCENGDVFALFRRTRRGGRQVRCGNIRLRSIAHDSSPGCAASPIARSLTRKPSLARPPKLLPATLRRLRDRRFAGVAAPSGAGAEFEETWVVEVTRQRQTSAAQRGARRVAPLKERKQMKRKFRDELQRTHAGTSA